MLTFLRARRAARAALVLVLTVLGLSVLTPASAADPVWSPEAVIGTVTIPAPPSSTSFGAPDCRPSAGTSIGAVQAVGRQVSFRVEQTGATGGHVHCDMTVVFPVCIDVFGVNLCTPTSGTFGTDSDTYYVDRTPPTGLSTFLVGTAPNPAGWFRFPGQVKWTAGDSASGIASCDTLAIGPGDTAGQTLVGGCTNRAGLSTTSGFDYRYDGTAPTLAPSVTPSVVGLGETATADPGAADALSGVLTAGCNAGQALDTSTVGAHAVTCTARDVAGNQATATASYTVGYGFGGFASPVDESAVNIVKAGQTVPLKFTVTGVGGAPVTDLSSVGVKATALTCDLGDTVSLLDESATGGSGLQNLGGGLYQFNWSTPKSYASSCKTLHLDLGDGIAHDVEFRFRK